MLSVSSYKVKILGYNHIFDDTLAVYRNALAYLIDAVNTDWHNICAAGTAKDQMMFVEFLIHNTSKNVAKYDFDNQFYKFPSYLRRSAIADAIGKVASYRSNHENWLNNGRKGNPPTLQMKHFAYPALFKDNMFVRVDDYTAKIKIFHQNDW